MVSEERAKYKFSDYKLREYWITFASISLEGIIKNNLMVPHTLMANTAFDIADAMMDEMKKRAK